MAEEDVLPKSELEQLPEPMADPSPKKKKGRPLGSKNKKKVQKKGSRRRGQRPKEAEIYVRPEYYGIGQVPSNAVFCRAIPRYGKEVQRDPETRILDTRWQFQRLLDEHGMFSGDVLVVASPDPSWQSYKAGEIIDSENCLLDPGYFKVVQILPITETRVRQIAYQFVKALLEKVGITLSRSTHRMLGQWAAAINVQIDELKQAVRPFVREMQAKLLATKLDDPQPLFEVEPLIPEERLQYIAYLFAKWVIQVHGIRLLKRDLTGELSHWANEIGVPIDEIKMAIKPIIEELEVDIFTPRTKVK